MATYTYRALKPDGTKSEGEVTAKDRPDAVRILSKRGMQPVSVQEGTSSPAVKKGGKSTKAGKAASKSDTSSKKGKQAEKPEPLPKGGVKLKRAQVILFTEELSDLLTAGLQLEPALRIMESREELSNIKVVTQVLRQEVRDGTNFSTALRKASPSFGDLYCNLAAAGEASGALDTILKRQAEYLLAMQDLQGKVVFALIYPAFLALSGLGVTVLFTTFLIPQLTTLLETTGGAPPAGAVYLMLLADFVKKWWWLILVLVILAVVTLKILLQDQDRRRVWDEWILKLPLFGSVLSTRFYVQFMETLANLIHNGLPLTKGLELTRNATMNLYLRELMDKVIDSVGDGGSLSRTLKRVGFFPPLLIDMVAVGEQTGNIAPALERASARYDKELGKTIQKISALIQPLVVVVMAVIVGAMAYLMISIIFETISGLRSR